MIVVHAAGGPVLGVGHLARARTVADALAGARDTHVLLVLEAPPDASRPFARGAADTEVVASREEALAAIDGAGPAEVLVTDLLGLTAADREAARERGHRWLVQLNDDGMGHYRPDLVISTDAAPPPLAPPPGTTVAAGALLHPIRPDVRRLRPDAPVRPEAAERVVVALGGADPGGCTETLLDRLAELDDRFRPTVVVGPAVPPGRRDSVAARRGCDVVVDPTDLPHLMAGADLVVTLGGLTSYEAMCLGRPVAAVGWEHLAPVVRRLAAAGLVADLGSDPAAELLRLVRDADRLSSLARTGFDLIDGRGADRIRDLVLGLVDRGRGEGPEEGG